MEVYILSTDGGDLQRRKSILGKMGPGVFTTQHAYMLLHNPWAAHQPVEHAYRLSSILWDDFDVVEFASLVSRTSQIRALGQ